MYFPLVFLLIENEDDRQFLEQVYLEYHRLMYAQALRVTRSDAEAQDVVSDSLMALMKKIKLLRTLECNKLRSYVVITVKHIAFTRFNRQKRERVVDDAALEDLSGGGTVEEGVLAQAGVEGIKEAIRSLPAREKEIMLMKYFRELSDDEIAEELGLRPVSVRVQLSRARKHLSEMLKRREGK